MKYPKTPDGRYFVHRERLWRCSNPALSEQVRQELVNQLMEARRDVRRSKQLQDTSSLADARRRVNAAKVALGERGETWWDDDLDFNRHMIQNTPYAEWWIDSASGEASFEG